MAYKVKASLHTCLTDSHVQTARAVFVKRAGCAYLLAHKADVGQSKAPAHGGSIKAACHCESKAHIKSPVIWILLPCLFLTLVARFATNFLKCIYDILCTQALLRGTNGVCCVAPSSSITQDVSEHFTVPPLVCLPPSCPTTCLSPSFMFHVSCFFSFQKLMAFTHFFSFQTLSGTLKV